MTSLRCVEDPNSAAQTVSVGGRWGGESTHDHRLKGKELILTSQYMYIDWIVMKNLKIQIITVHGEWEAFFFFCSGES